MKNRKTRPTIAEAKAMDMVSYLANLGFKPEHISRNDYWYISPLRSTERTASFKVNRAKNVWYDHGEGKGGNIITFGLLFYRCNIPEFLDSLAGIIHLIPPADSISTPAGTNTEPESVNIAILKICPLQSAALINYLRERQIPLYIADRYCKEIHYTANNATYYGIGFENNQQGFEIRNPYAKITSPPKAIRTLSNGANSVHVFEGFIDFLSFVTIHPEHPDFPKDYVILNSINQFEKARDFMENHAFIHLYLDQDTTGENYTAYALSISDKYVDESLLYSGYKDLNEWLVQSKDRNAPRQSSSVP